MEKTFLISEDKRNITWKYLEQNKILIFNVPILRAVFIGGLQRILVIADPRDVGSRNLMIYNLKGEIIANPEMPKLNKDVDGIFQLWYDEGKIDQTVVLLTDEYAPYDTRCTFNLNTYEFSDFKRTK